MASPKHRISTSPWFRALMLPLDSNTITFNLTIMGFIHEFAIRGWQFLAIFFKNVNLTLLEWCLFRNAHCWNIALTSLKRHLIDVCVTMFDRQSRNIWGGYWISEKYHDDEYVLSFEWWEKASKWHWILIQNILVHVIHFHFTFSNHVAYEFHFFLVLDRRLTLFVS